MWVAFRRLESLYKLLLHVIIRKKDGFKSAVFTKCLLQNGD
jgi:hypothetical protein